TANENPCFIVIINRDRIPPHDRFTDWIAGVVDDGSRRHLDPFTCRIDGIRNEVAASADFPSGAMPVGDTAAKQAGGTAEGLKPGSHVVRNVVPSAVVESPRWRRDQ